MSGTADLTRAATRRAASADAPGGPAESYEAQKVARRPLFVDIIVELEQEHVDLITLCLAFLKAL
jgi:hypothetical protein